MIRFYPTRVQLAAGRRSAISIRHVVKLAVNRNVLYL